MHALRPPRPPVRSLEGMDPSAADCAQTDFESEDAQMVHAALNQLPTEQREVLLLRFIEDMSYEEIARVTACPVGTVRSRIHYAKHALRRVLERTATT